MSGLKYYLFYIVQRLLLLIIPVNKSRVVFFTRGPSGCNSIALYRYACKNNVHDLELKIVRTNSQETVYERVKRVCSTARARVVVTTHGGIKVRKNQISVELWHSFPFKGSCLMDKNSSSYSRQKARFYWRNISIISSYSPLYTMSQNACFGTMINQYQVTGAPRNDFLFYPESAEKNLARLLSYGNGEELVGQRLLLYMPTFRHGFEGRTEGMRDESNFFGFPDFDINELNSFLEKQQLFIVLKLHPFEESKIALWLDALHNSRIKILTSAMLEENGIDMYEVLAGTAALITDYSSIFFDYLLLDRPLFFTPVDLSAYRESRGLMFEPYEMWTPGEHCVTQNSFLQAMSGFAKGADPHAAERKRLKDIVHSRQDGNSSERVWGIIEQEMKTRGYLGA